MQHVQAPQGQQMAGWQAGPCLSTCLLPRPCLSLPTRLSFSSRLLQVVASAFDLLFAFDEVISLGHKENVTVVQVRGVAALLGRKCSVWCRQEGTRHRRAVHMSNRSATDCLLCCAVCLAWRVSGVVCVCVLRRCARTRRWSLTRRSCTR